jgi:hypothetical protein
VVDGSGIARSSIAAAARFWPTPWEAGGGLALTSSELDALGQMTRFSGRSSVCPFLPDVPPKPLKCSCSLVEPGLYLADLLELCVLTPRRGWDHS